LLAPLKFKAASPNSSSTCLLVLERLVTVERSESYDLSLPSSSALLSASTGVFSFRWLLASASATFQNINADIFLEVQTYLINL
jgi:hypothetical protein